MEERRDGWQFLTGLGRAFGGAVLFAFPLLMTEEMWRLGFSMDRLRLALLIAVTLPLLAGISHFSGFEKTASWREDAEDAFVAYGVGFLASAALLALFGMVGPGMTAGEIVGKIGIQAVPASIGAIAASKQFHSGGDDRDEDRRASYGGELFLMAAGAVFIAFNVAPTDEMPAIAFAMTPWHAVALMLASVAALHALVYAVGFAGQEERPERYGFLRTFTAFTLAGYGVALLVSLYVLWSFERTDGMSLAGIAVMTVVLGFPAALGAATARLIV